MVDNPISPKELLAKGFVEIEFEGVKGYSDLAQTIIFFFTDEIYDKLKRYDISPPKVFILPKSEEVKEYPTPALNEKYGAVIYINIVEDIDMESNRVKGLYYMFSLFSPILLRWYLKSYNIPIRTGTYTYYTFGRTYVSRVLIKIKDGLWILFQGTLSGMYGYRRCVDVVGVTVSREAMSKVTFEYERLYNHYLHSSECPFSVTVYTDAFKYFPNAITFKEFIERFGLPTLETIIKEGLDEEYKLLAKRMGISPDELKIISTAPQRATNLFLLSYLKQLSDALNELAYRLEELARRPLAPPPELKAPEVKLEELPPEEREKMLIFPHTGYIVKVEPVERICTKCGRIYPGFSDIVIEFLVDWLPLPKDLAYDYFRMCPLCQSEHLKMSPPWDYIPGFMAVLPAGTRTPIIKAIEEMRKLWEKIYSKM